MPASLRPTRRRRRRPGWTGTTEPLFFLGGVPQSILYDTDKCLVSRILSDGTRQRTRAFSGLQSHYLFEDRYGRPGKGNDKGNVEGVVGYARRNFMTPAAATEAWLDGHNRAFVFFGGVPQSILYDNDKCLVSRILSDGTRQRTRAFSGLQSHYLFEDRYGRPGKGNDKGNVEGVVGYAGGTS